MTHLPRFTFIIVALALTALTAPSSAPAALAAHSSLLPVHTTPAPASSTFAAAPAPASTASPAVRRAVTAYLQARADATAVGGSLQALRARFAPASPVARREVLTALGDLLFHERMGDYPVACVSRLLDESIAVAGARAVAEATEHYEMHFSARSRRSSTEGGVLHHRITLRLCGDRWLVADDAYQDDGSEAYLRAASAPQALIEAARRAWQAEAQARLRAQIAQGWLATAVSGIPAPALATAAPCERQSRAHPVRPFKDRFAYRRAAAVAYALRWFGGHNTYYNNYAGQGGDCANFVSQCVGDEPPAPAPNGGGLWRFGLASDPLNHQWWFRPAPYRQQSQSWTFCPTQAAAWRWPQPGHMPASYVYAYSSTVPSGYARGDVVWLTDASGTQQHAMICTSFSGSTPLFTCHSPGVHDKPRSYFGWSSQRYARLVDTVTIG
jgi:hypothetical protein